MKRSGFTMIELIFVIVILGILASVAIPKLAATRDDAKVSKALSEVSTLVSELGSFYTAQGNFDGTDIKTLTNVNNVTKSAAVGVDAVKATAIASGTPFYYSTKTSAGILENCIKFTPNNTDGNLTVEPATGTGNICKGILASSSFTNDLSGTKLFGGSRVSF